MRRLSAALTSDAWADLEADGLKRGVVKNSGRVYLKHSNGHIGVGSSIGQAWDDLMEKSAA